MNEEGRSGLPPDGRFPGWVAVAGMAVCPLVGVFMVALTTWRTRSKLAVGIGGLVIWVAAFWFVVVFRSTAGPTGA